jgi:hypothetical protein
MPTKLTLKLYSRLNRKHKQYMLFFILFLLPFCIFIAFPCFAGVDNSKDPLISLSSKNESLKIVLDKISNITGYKIEITEGWGNKPVTLDIQAMTLDDSLKKIIRALGSPNNVKIDYDNKKVIRINFFDTSKDISLTQNNNDFNQLQAKQAEAVINIENLPPSGDNKKLKDTASKIDPLDIEVLPPNKPGEKGKTKRELLKIQGEKKELNPHDIDILPPKNPGEKGISQRELESSQKGKSKQIDLLELEVIPTEVLNE